MPKDPKRNRSNYDIGGGDINEFEFHQNQGAMAEEERARFEQSEAERRAGEVPEAGPQSEAERIQQMMEDAREKVARKKAKEARKAEATASSSNAKKGKGGAGQATAKKAAAKKAAPAKPAAKKAGGKKSAAVKATAKKSGAKKGSTKQSGAKGAKSATRKPARNR